MSMTVAAFEATGTLPNLPIASWPLAPPPPGRLVSHRHRESNIHQIHVTAAVCIPLIVLFAAIRAYNKIGINRGRTWDDYTFMLASVCTIVYIGVVTALLDDGMFGFHIWDLVVGDLRNSSFLLVLIIEALWGPFIWFIKLSVFLMYLQLFHPFPWARRMAWLGITVTGLFYFSVTVARIALCAPRGGDSYIEAFSTARCHSTKKVGIASGSFNVVSDIFLLALPVPCVWKLSLKRKQKMGVIAGFMTGISVVEMACGIAFLVGPSIASVAKRHRLDVSACVKRINDDDGLRGRFIRMTSFGGESRTLGKQHWHGHKASADSDTKLRSTTTDSATIDEVNSQPKY
ncbi:MAG: hypothetical protein L6R35_003883 [Caloplaca aegaea]|nr:MAG: hypothetical protein L6R35_003883 [Caloplaca aegaea]